MYICINVYVYIYIYVAGTFMYYLAWFVLCGLLGLSLALFVPPLGIFGSPLGLSWAFVIPPLTLL